VSAICRDLKPRHWRGFFLFRASHVGAPQHYGCLSISMNPRLPSGGSERRRQLD
jgi:hypothetical protein